MDEKKELTDLSKVDWKNISAEEFARLLVEAMENMTDDEREELRAGASKYLAPVSPFHTRSSRAEE